MTATRCIQVLNGVIINVILADHTFDPGDGSQIIASDNGQVGDSYVNGVITPAPAPTPVVPDSVALWQAKAAMQASGLLDKANAAIAAAGNPVLTAFWAGATSIDRASPTLAMIGAGLGLSGAQIDALFIQAAQISL